MLDKLVQRIAEERPESAGELNNLMSLCVNHAVVFSIYCVSMLSPSADKHETIRSVIGLHSRVIAGDNPTMEEWGYAEMTAASGDPTELWAAMYSSEAGYSASISHAYPLPSVAAVWAARYAVNAGSNWEQQADYLIGAFRDAK